MVLMQLFYIYTKIYGMGVAVIYYYYYLFKNKSRNNYSSIHIVHYSLNIFTGWDFKCQILIKCHTITDIPVYSVPKHQSLIVFL